jgi:hypothetical protein
MKKIQKLKKISKISRKSKPTYRGIQLRELRPEFLELKSKIIKRVCSYEIDEIKNNYNNNNNNNNDNISSIIDINEIEERNSKDSIELNANIYNEDELNKQKEEIINNIDNNTKTNNSKSI